MRITGETIKRHGTKPLVGATPPGRYQPELHTPRHTEKMQATRYIETRNENITTEEAIALYNCEAKPYPSLWYQSEKSFITRRNASQWWELQDCKEAIASGSCDEEEIDWSEFSCPLHKWQYLVATL